MEKQELLVEIEHRYETRGLGYVGKNGQRVSTIGTVGEALFAAAEKAQEPAEEHQEG